MRKRLLYSPQVSLDLDEIYDYFASDLGDPEKGAEVVDGILSAARQISGHATRYPRVGPFIYEKRDRPNFRWDA